MTTEAIPKKKVKSPSTRRRDANRKITFLQKKSGHQTKPLVNVTALSATNADLQTSLQKKDDHIQSLTISVSQLQTQLELASQHLKQLKNCDEENETLRARVSEMKRQQKDHDRQQQTKEVNTHRLTEDNRILCKDMASKIDQMTELKTICVAAETKLKNYQDEVERLTKENDTLLDDSIKMEPYIVRDDSLHDIFHALNDLMEFKEHKPKVKCEHYQVVLAEFAKLMESCHIHSEKHAATYEDTSIGILDCAIDISKDGLPVRYFLVEYACNCPPHWEREHPRLNKMIGNFYKNARRKYLESKHFCDEFPPK